MDILITGITGRIGANLAAKLLDEGHEVRGLVWPQDPRTEKLESLDLELVDGSLTNQEDVERAAQDMDCIYHLGAAFQGGGPFTENDYFEINMRGTFNILEAARKRPSQLIFASTDAVLEKYLPTLRAIESGDAIDQGGFPGTVGADQCQELTFEDIQGNTMQYSNTAKG